MRTLVDLVGSGLGECFVGSYFHDTRKLLKPAKKILSIHHRLNYIIVVCSNIYSDISLRLRSDILRKLLTAQCTLSAYRKQLSEISRIEQAKFQFNLCDFCFDGVLTLHKSFRLSGVSFRFDLIVKNLPSVERYCRDIFSEALLTIDFISFYLHQIASTNNISSDERKWERDKFRVSVITRV